jgi:O-succinylbenzoate synthase
MPVRIDEIRLTHVRVPLHEPFVISSGSVAEKDAILIELAGEGLVGVGEASPMAGSFYSHHTPDACWDDLIGNLLPRLRRIPEITPRTFLAASESLDDPFARSGIETAMWDLLARAEDRPLWQLLGGAHAATVESGLAVGIYDTVATLVERIGRYLDQDGYRRVKIKVQPGWDVEPLEAVRAAWPDVPLMVDANAAYRREHIDHIASWDRFALMMIEQPLPGGDLEGHAHLASRCGTPICLDESATSASVVREAIDRGAARIINIKLQRVGGFTGALDIHNTAQAAGVGSMWTTRPGNRLSPNAGAVA